MPTRKTTSAVWTALGWAGIAFFVLIYAAEFIPRHGPPVTVRWLSDTFGRGGLIAINILVVVAFLALLPYRRSTRGTWKSRGAFVAFVIALMTEMFGWPLVIFLVSPLVDVPSIAPAYFKQFGHTGATVGTVVSMLGVGLIAAGWIRIHRAEGPVTTGLYRFIRHPQYTGIFLFTLGWLLHWPSLVTLMIWPVLVGAYVWLARREEQAAVQEFGAVYSDYMKRSKRFIPFIV